MTMQNIGHAAALAQYEQSQIEPPTDVPLLRGHVVSAMGMRCTICGRLYDWYPSLEALQRLMSRYEVRDGKKTA
jgi:hypothetical protein